MRLKGGEEMSFFDAMKKSITKQPANLKRPLFYKSDSDAQRQLEKLQELLETAPNDLKSWIEQDIKLLAYGIAGEEAVAFELNNSTLPVIVLHDLYIQHEGLTAQIDYMIITNKLTLLVECKNLFGNIEVNSNGDFIRTMEFYGRKKKEGIYSPITQSMRHLDMIKKVRRDAKGNFLTQTLFDKYFDDNYKSVVVLANPKTVVNLKYARKEVKNKIIRCDQLIEYIKKLLQDSNSNPRSEKDMYEMAAFFMKLHTENTVDYTKKYKIAEDKTNNYSTVDMDKSREAARGGDSKTEGDANKAETGGKLEDTPLYKALKQYRYDTSKAEGVKAFYIFTNAQLEELIAIKPENIEELRKVPGFGDARCEKYGEGILAIIKRSPGA